MPDYYSEPFLNRAGLTHKSALIAWGAFHFRVKNNEWDFKLVDDDDLKHVHSPRLGLTRRWLERSYACHPR